MLLEEIKQLIKPNELAQRAPEMPTPNVYDKKNIGIGKKMKPKTEKITVKDSKTGKVYGYRTVVQ